MSLSIERKDIRDLVTEVVVRALGDTAHEGEAVLYSGWAALHGRRDVLDRLARELVEFRPNVIAVSNGDLARAVLRASKTIPIVVAASSDLKDYLS